MKRILSAITFIVTMILISTINVFATATIDTSTKSEGYITVTASANMVVQISKGDEKYNYVLTDSNATSFPLQLGDGTYKVLVLKKVSASQYTAAASETFTATIGLNEVYLNSIQLINFNGQMISIKDLTSVVATGTSDLNKTELLYGYILDHMTYDYDKASVLANSSNYLPVIDDTYVSQKGICYDVSSLVASVLRHNGIPTKLVMGYTQNVSTYHAWNEVYYNGAWHVIDITYDIGVRISNQQTTMEKNANDYSVTKLY